MRIHRIHCFTLLSIVLIGCVVSPTSTPEARQARPTAAQRTPTATRVSASTSTAAVAAISTRAPFTPTQTSIALPSALPNRAQPYYDEGQSFAHQFDYGKAVEAYTQAIQLKPDFTEAYLQRGLAYCFQHDTDNALADWKRIGELPAPGPIEIRTRSMAANFLVAFSSGC